jgi:Cd2+/Zn2+-exporting ATPase
MGLWLARIAAGFAMLAAGLVLEHFFDVHGFIPAGIFIAGYLTLGSDIVIRAVRNIFRGRVFDENFLMSIATIGAFAIGEHAEAVAVMLFYQVGEFFQGKAVAKSRRSIAALMDIRPDYANIYKNGHTTRVSPENVRIGDVIIVKPGEKIPLDGVVAEGESLLDTAALTGEAVPRRVAASDEVLSGCVNQNSVLMVKVTKTYGESTVAKIIELVENAASKKAPTEKFITKFARYYTPAVVLLAVLIAVIPPAVTGGGFTEWLHRGLIFLVISCPCALVLSIPLSFFGGIGGASRRGILVKGGNYLEALASLDIAVFDKTGTLTKGVFAVSRIVPVNGYTEDDVLSLAAKAEVYSNHPIASSILRSYGKEIDKTGLSGYKETAGQGVSVESDGTVVLAGNAVFMVNSKIFISEVNDIGTKVYVASNGVYAGCIIISDEIKADGANAVSGLKERGVRKTVMLTGDNPQTAETVARETGIDEVYAGLLPGEKVEKLEMLMKLRKPGGKLAFVGDGINDAPVLAMADIGVAMGGLGSDAAIEAADVVLMTDEPSKLVDAIETANATRRIVTQNIVLALGTKGIILLLGAVGMASMWGAVFADVGVSLLAVVNAMRLLRRG